MFNSMMELLSDVPGNLAVAWAMWFGAGALLVMWYRKAREAELEMYQPVASRTVARAKSGPRPVAVVEPRTMPEPRLATPKPFGEPIAVAVPRPKPSPLVVGDPFGDLATLLDQPVAEQAAPFRTPADSPILNSAGSPVLRNNDPDPKY